MRHGMLGTSVVCAIVALLPVECGAETAAKLKPPTTIAAVEQVLDKRGDVQLITFPDTGWNPVKLVRGNQPAKRRNAPPARAEKPEIAEIVSFRDRQTASVRVVRGETERVTGQSGELRPVNGMALQVVTFADPRDRPVSILRGLAPYDLDTGLHAAAAMDDLDRVAFAVDGVESGHGADLGMWRPELTGPQGPMQVSAAAAVDVGGGNRFDLAGNRALGRAYLARMYRRYGNWPDALAAYNWGPGNMDWWIISGRGVDGIPLEVERYRDRVLRSIAPVHPPATQRPG